MKFKRAISLAIICIAASPLGAWAQSAENQSAEELAKKYIELPQVQEMMTEMFSPETTVAQMQAMMGPNVKLTDEQKSEIGKLMSEKLSAIKPDLQSAMESAAASNFTADELQALIEFYSSPLGGAVMKKMPKYQAEAMGQIGPKMQAMTLSLIPEIQKIMAKSE